MVFIPIISLTNILVGGKGRLKSEAEAGRENRVPIT
jgi:hypothetical protein